MKQTFEIDFCGDKLFIILNNGEPFTAVKPISEHLGLDWRGQLQVIKNNEELSSTVEIISTVDTADGKRRKMVFLPLKSLHAWLLNISPSKCREECRDKIRAYKKTCYDVIHDYFWHGGAINPEASPMQLQMLQAQIEHYQRYLPRDVEGAESKVNGRPRIFMVRAYPRSKPRKSCELHPDLFGGFFEAPEAGIKKPAPEDAGAGE